ncbi:hypothetical protein KC357_g124 [Hortaea werneckii]|nr:hypothetical protein KC357_g124 [Hortaea werneckii]
MLETCETVKSLLKIVSQARACAISDLDLGDSKSLLRPFLQRWRREQQVEEPVHGRVLKEVAVKFQALRFDNLMRQRDEVGLELLRLPLLASSVNLKSSFSDTPPLSRAARHTPHSCLEDEEDYANGDCGMDLSDQHALPHHSTVHCGDTLDRICVLQSLQGSPRFLAIIENRRARLGRSPPWLRGLLVPT